MTQKQASNPFKFSTQANLVELTGVKARDVRELHAYLKIAPGAVIYHHTHHFLRQHQFLSPEPPNDFAYWVTNVLNEDKLGEQLAAIDIVRFPSIRALQEKIAEVMEQFLTSTKLHRSAPDGEEFHFMKSKSFILPTPYVAWTLGEFSECIRKVSIYSLYHHMFEARMRLGRETNDFSFWLEGELGEKTLAQRIRHLDPYTHTLEGLRQRILLLTNWRLESLNREGMHAS
ncbi:MAG: hypothetical protein KCHDKBKB_02313 [Elusimicrobia bacterium]|nr:hypothetical protein [Elusimicrobiota bacterium]